MVRLQSDAKGLIAGFAAGERSVQKFAGVAAVAGLAVGAVFAGMATSMAIDFDKGMREVNTLISLSEVAFKDLEDDVLSFANLMGVTAKETVPALYQAISAGVPRDNVFEFMEVGAKAAIGGVTDLMTAIDGLTSVTNAYGRDNRSVTKGA